MKSTEPILTTLSYSGGVQSHALLEMVLRGDLEMPRNFLVLNADPGMENQHTYELIHKTKERCKVVGINFLTVKGPNLYWDLMNFKQHNFKRLDNPPYWTKNRTTGKIAKLKQNCTPYYKIAPIRVAMREFMEERFGLSRKTTHLPKVDIWIGFAADESNRAEKASKSKKNPKYCNLRFPLIELGMDRLKVDGYYLKNGIDKPPRSVCNACFANGLKHFEEMYQHRPDDWDHAVAVDDNIRDMSVFGVKDEVFVSSTCIPLRDLPKLGFKKYDEDYAEHRCNSGACFI